jgi:hypothetical protein
MSSEQKPPEPAGTNAPGDATLRRRPLNETAQRALAEAAARRAAREQKPASAEPPEINGRRGLDPTRYGDWEVNGLIADF